MQDTQSELFSARTAYTIPTQISLATTPPNILYSKDNSARLGGGEGLPKSTQNYSILPDNSIKCLKKHCSFTAECEPEDPILVEHASNEHGNIDKPIVLMCHCLKGDLAPIEATLHLKNHITRKEKSRFEGFSKDVSTQYLGKTD